MRCLDKNLPAEDRILTSVRISSFVTIFPLLYSKLAGFILRPPPENLLNLDLVFSWNSTTRITGGIIRIVSQDLLDRFLRELKSLRHLSSQPLVLGLSTLEAVFSTAPSWLYAIGGDIVAVQSRTGHLGGMAISSVNLQGPLDYDQVTLEVSSMSQLVSWYHCMWKSYLHLYDFLAQSATRSEMFEDRNISGCQMSSPASVKHSEVFSELLSAMKNRIIHDLDVLGYYKELCVIQNQTVRLDSLAKYMKPLI